MAGLIVPNPVVRDWPARRIQEQSVQEVAKSVATVIQSLPSHAEADSPEAELRRKANKAHRALLSDDVRLAFGALCGCMGICEREGWIDRFGEFDDLCASLQQKL